MSSADRPSGLWDRLAQAAQFLLQGLGPTLECRDLDAVRTDRLLESQGFAANLLAGDARDLAF